MTKAVTLLFLPATVLLFAVRCSAADESRRLDMSLQKTEMQSRDWLSDRAFPPRMERLTVQVHARRHAQLKRLDQRAIGDAPTAHIRIESKRRHTRHGKGTFYQPDRGACGHINRGSDYIGALSVGLYESGKHCGKSVQVCHDGKCIGISIQDECPGCATNQIDLSPAAFKALAPETEGEIDIQWHFQ